MLVSRVGADELGRRALEALAQARVDTRHVGVDPERPTGTVRIDLSGREPRFAIGEEVAWDRIEWSPALACDLARAQVVVFGTLAQRTPLGAGALATALGAAAPDAWHLGDLNLRPPFVGREVVEASLRRAHAVKLNGEEAAAVGKLFGTDDPVSWLLGQPTVRLVALTLGARGSLIASRTDRSEHPGFALSGSGGDSVGAGDAFTAALATLLPLGSSLSVMGRVANRYAAYVASCAGAMPPVPQEILDELARLREES
jgi:fructokinase